MIRAWRSLRFRVVAAFGLALLALSGAQGFLFWQNQRIASDLALITEVYLPMARITAQLDRDRQRVENDARRVVREGPRGGPPSNAPTQLAENLVVANAGVASAQREHADDDEAAVLAKVRRHLDRIVTYHERFAAQIPQVLGAVEAGDKEGAAAALAALQREGVALGAEIDRLDRQIDVRTRALTVAAERAQVRATTFAGLLSLAAGVVSLGAMALLLIALAPVGRLTAGVKALAKGDYSGRIEASGSDEIADLAAEFNRMAEALAARDRSLVQRAEELRRLSGYLVSVLDHLGDALFVVEGGEITLCNPAAERVFGVVKGERLTGALASLAAQPGRHALRTPEGRDLEVRASSFGNGGALVVSEDVTERNHDAERLARSERLALVGQMLAQVTHEVRNPLNALSLNADLLGDELRALDPDGRTEAAELMALIANEIERLTAVTGHYLQLARRPPARLDAEDLGELIEDVARLVQPELEQHGATLVLEKETVPPQRVDGNQLRQALLNVVQNAVQAGGKALRCTLSAEGERVRVAVADDGPGMDDAAMARAFDPFFSTKAQGTGLGLAITRQILEDHGGTVNVDSAPGRGTTVVFELPRRSALEGADVGDDPRRG